MTPFINAAPLEGFKWSAILSSIACLEWKWLSTKHPFLLLAEMRSKCRVHGWTVKLVELEEHLSMSLQLTWPAAHKQPDVVKGRTDVAVSAKLIVNLLKSSRSKCGLWQKPVVLTKWQRRYSWIVLQCRRGSSVTASSSSVWRRRFDRGQL